MNAREASGRRVLLLAAAAAVTVGFLVGSFVGGISAERGTSLVAFGLVALPTGSLAVGLYAALLGLIVVVGLLGGVRYASRFDDERVE